MMRERPCASGATILTEVTAAVLRISVAVPEEDHLPEAAAAAVVVVVVVK